MKNFGQFFPHLVQKSTIWTKIGIFYITIFYITTRSRKSVALRPKPTKYSPCYFQRELGPFGLVDITIPTLYFKGIRSVTGI